MLKEHGLNKFKENSDPPPKGINELEKWECDNNKAMKLIVDGVKTHLLPVISELDTTHEMYNALGNMFEINNVVRITGFNIDITSDIETHLSFVTHCLLSHTYI